MPSSPNSKELFNNLVANAFDFLREAVTVFKRSPKLSAIHFFTATELLLKARLVKEHWSLLFLKPEDASAIRLNQGDLQSVGLKDAHKRLVEVAGAEFPRQAFDAFEALRKHRNKLVHLYSSADLSDPKSSVRLEIVREQCRGWHYLYELLTRHWSDHFQDHADAIDEAARQMRRHKEFLRVRFAELKSLIKEKVAAGSKQHRCYLCDQKALIEEQPGPNLLRPATCVVCERDTAILTVNCSCKEPIIFIGEGFGRCVCGEDYTPKSLADLLHDNNYNPAKGDESGRATCTACECSECESVIPFDGSYICTSCFTTWDESKIGKCEWCSDRYAGAIEDSYFVGCPNCDGHSGHMSSKDD